MMRLIGSRASTMSMICSLQTQKESLSGYSISRADTQTMTTLTTCMKQERRCHIISIIGWSSARIAIIILQRRMDRLILEVSRLKEQRRTDWRSGSRNCTRLPIFIQHYAIMFSPIISPQLTNGVRIWWSVSISIKMEWKECIWTICMMEILSSVLITIADWPSRYWLTLTMTWMVCIKDMILYCSCKRQQWAMMDSGWMTMESRLSRPQK